MKTYKVKVNGKSYEVVLEAVGETASAPAAAPAAAPATPAKATGEGIKAPIGGKLLKVNVKVGDVVKKGDVVAIIEAMKLENEVPSPEAGTVKSICAKPGDAVNNGDLIIELA